MKFSDKFIKANDKVCDFKEFVQAPYFRRKFNLGFKPENAEITICGLGFYELYVNGKNITKAPLAPYISNPEEVLYYDNYDIAENLKEGENVVGVILGNGMRNPYGGFAWGFEKASGRGPVTFALCIEAENGENSFILEADEKFKTHPSPILYDDLRMGYCYDARIEIPSWCDIDFNDDNWDFCLTEKTPDGIKRLCEVEPIVVEKELKPIEIKHYDRHPFMHYKWGEPGKAVEDSYRDNVYVYDFGINTAGVTKLKINGKPGQKIVIRHGEELINGEFSVNTTVFQRGEEQSRLYREYGQVDTFICKGGYEEFVPKFKYDGFRYAYVEGLESEQATEDAVTYLVMHSDLKRRADFSCSDEVLNELYKCTINSDYSNFFYFPTDCPHREKHGWTGDAWVSSEQMLLNLTAENSLREWFFNIRQVQRENGELPCIIPTVNWGFEWGNGPTFDAFCVQIPYYLYKYTGNKEIIRENFEMIVKYLKYISNKRDIEGLIEFGLGDWCDPNAGNIGFSKETLPVIATIIIYDIAKKAGFLFNQAGLNEEQKFAEDFASELRGSIRENLIEFKTMTVKGNCQSMQTLGIACGIFDENEISQARERLLEIIHNDGDIISCGMFGKRFLFYVLAEMGEAELAYKMITSKDKNGFGYWIENGATSLWERFKYIDDVAADNSKNHHFYGHISAWFIQELAGLKPNPKVTDISEFEISPNFISQLNRAKAYYDSVFGRVYVEWIREDGKIVLTVKAPLGTKGDIKLKDGYAFEDGTNLKTWNLDGTDIRLEIIENKE